MTTDPLGRARYAFEPGARPEEAAAIVAVLTAAADPAETSNDEAPQISAWRRAARVNDPDSVLAELAAIAATLSLLSETPRVPS